MGLISILGTKGGVGKSTLSMGLAIWISKLKPRDWTLLIDGDMHVKTIGLKMCPVTDVTLGEVLEEDKPVEEAIYQCELETGGKPLYPQLAILPAGGNFLPHMRGSPLDYLTRTLRRFDQMLKVLRKRFTYVIVDTPASVGFEHLILTAIADRVIYVCEANDDSIEATKATARELRKFMNVEPLGSVINRVPTYIDKRVWVRKATKIARLLGVIPEDDAVGEAFRVNLPVVAAAPDCPASDAMKGIAYKVLAEELRATRFPDKIERALSQTAERLEKKG